MSEKITRIFL